MVPTKCIITLSKNTFQNTSNCCKTFQNNSKHDECSKSKNEVNDWFPLSEIQNIPKQQFQTKMNATIE